jgi:hypothetical protein
MKVNSYYMRIQEKAIVVYLRLLIPDSTEETGANHENLLSRQLEEHSNLKPSISGISIQSVAIVRGLPANPS